jgi:hypothetical protein
LKKSKFEEENTMKSRYHSFNVDEIDKMLLDVLLEYGSNANALTIAKALREAIESECNRKEDEQNAQH